MPLPEQGLWNMQSKLKGTRTGLCASKRTLKSSSFVIFYTVIQMTQNKKRAPHVVLMGMQIGAATRGKKYGGSSTN